MVQTQHGLESSLSRFRIKLTLEHQYHGLGSAWFRIQVIRVQDKPYTRTVPWFRLSMFQNLVYQGSGLTLHWNINIMVQTQHGLESSLSGFRINLTLEQYHVQAQHVLESSLSGLRIKLTLCHVGCTTYTKKVKYVFETRE